MANTILSVMAQGRGDMSWLEGLAPRVVKLMDVKQDELGNMIRNPTPPAVDRAARQAEIDTIKSLTPDSYIINRIYVPDHEVSEAIRQDPEAAAEDHHQLILSKRLTGVDYYQIQNEQHQHPPELDLLNRYYVRLINLAVSAGYKTTVIDCSVGNLHVGKDHPGDWPHVYDTLRLAQEHRFPVNVHQYSCKSFWNPEYDNDWYLHRLEHTAMPVLDREGFDKLIYVVGEFGLSDLLCNDIGKPGGWQNHRSHDEYKQDLINVMSYLLQWSDRILGYCCYLTFTFAPWQTHEMLGMNEDLAEFYSMNKQNIKPLIGEDGPEKKPLFNARVVGVGADRLNVRSAPGTQNPIVGTVRLGDVVKVYDIDNGWWEIRKGSLQGWSSAQYLERINEKDLQEQINVLKLITANHEGRIVALEGSPPAPPPGDKATLSRSIHYMNMGILGHGKSINVLQAFTTHNGSWEPDSSDIFAVEQWARDLYLLPPNHPNYHDDGGGDHHYFVRLDDDNGGFVAGQDVIFERWVNGEIVEEAVRQTSTKHGWCNIPLFHGAFWTARIGESQRMTPYSLPNADGTMPGREHVSLFVVFRPSSV